MINILLVVIYLLLSNIGLLLIKVGSSSNSFLISNRSIGVQLGYYSILGLFFYVLSFTIYFIVIQRFKLSYISPLISGISYIVIIILSFFFLQERISLYQWIGIGIILIGVVFMNIK